MAFANLWKHIVLRHRSSLPSSVPLVQKVFTACERDGSIVTLPPGSAPSPSRRSAGRGLGRGAQERWQPNARWASRCVGLLSPAPLLQRRRGGSVGGSARIRPPAPGMAAGKGWDVQTTWRAPLVQPLALVWWPGFATEGARCCSLGYPLGIPCTSLVHPLSIPYTREGTSAAERCLADGAASV